MKDVSKGFLFIFVLIVTLAAIASLLSFSSEAATDVSADIDADTTWNKAGSPYRIKDDIQVTGVTLTIRPGVEVVFTDRYSLVGGVTAKIMAVGTTHEPINFTSGSASPGKGDWSHITGHSSVFRNCTFKHGDVALIADQGTKATDCTLEKCNVGLQLDGDNLWVKDCTFKTVTRAVEADSTSGSVIMDCFVDRSQLGFKVSSSTMNTRFVRCVYNGSAGVGFEITGGSNCQFRQCEAFRATYGMKVEVSNPLNIYDCTFRDCNQAAISFAQAPSAFSTTVRRCRFYEANIGIRSEGSGGFEVTECTFRGLNTAYYVLDSAGVSVLHQNNLIANSEDVDTTNSETQYDKNGKGNYWSNYNKPDKNGDGIGDEPWFITGIQADHYPLMDPVDFVNPRADAGPDRKTKQNWALDLDGTGSYDDTWIANYTWTIDLPDDVITLHGAEPSVRVPVAGVFELVLTVTDPVGHTDSDTAVLTITDAESPRFTNITTPARSGAGQPLEFSAIIEDNTGVVRAWVNYKLGISGKNNILNLTQRGGDLWSGEVELPIDLRQKVFYGMHAVDAEGNRGRALGREVTVIDVTPPDISSAMGVNVTTGDMTWLNATITDNRQVIKAWVEYWFGEGDERITLNLSMVGVLWVVEVEIPWDAPTPMHLVFNATDAAGNWIRSDVIDVEVVDNDPPVLNLDSSTNRMHKGEKAEMRAVISDNMGIESVYVEVRYPPGADYSSIPLRLEDDTWVGEIDVARTGVWIYYHFRAVDTSGNVLVTSDVERPLRSQRPSIVTQPPAEAWEGELYQVDFDAEDPDNEDYEHKWSMETDAKWLQIDPHTGEISGTPEDRHVGEYWVNVSVEDPDAVSDHLYYTFIVHDVNAPPRVDISYPVDGQKVGTVLKVSGRATDDLDQIVWVRVRIDDGEWVNATGTTSWTYDVPLDELDLEAGNHYVDVMAYDGNNNSKVASVSFLVPKKEEDEGPGFGALVTLLAVLAATGAASLVFRRER